jgi:hypothetical protein
VKNPTVWISLGSSAAGAGVGYLQYLFEANKNQDRKLDPILILNVVQAQLGCQISFEALVLSDKVDTLLATKTGKGGDVLIQQIDQLHAQGKLLETHFERLENLFVNDFLFQRTLAHLPKSQSFQELRSMLVEDPAKAENTFACNQITLDNEFDSAMSALTARIDEWTVQNAPPPPPQENAEEMTGEQP